MTEPIRDVVVAVIVGVLVGCSAVLIAIADPGGWDVWRVAVGAVAFLPIWALLGLSWHRL